MAGANTSGGFVADVGYTKRPKHPKLPLAGESRGKTGEPSKRKKKAPSKKR